MIIEFWECSCRDKRNSANLTRCRRCGEGKPTIKLSDDGKDIHVIRKVADPNAGTVEAIVKKDTSSRATRPPANPPGPESFIQSTISFLED